MPRLYIDTYSFLSYPVAIAFAFQIQQLQNLPAGIDGLLARASKRVDDYARKRIISAPATTIATGGISIGGTVLPVTSTLGLDSGQEEAIIIGSGATQEILPIEQGGINVTSWSAPYPGTITLATPAAYNHSAGEIVQGCYQEVSTVGSSGSSDFYSEMYLQFTQEAQLAAAHAPYAGTQNLVRMIFLKCYPIRQLLMIEHMLPIATTYNKLDQSKIGIHPASGYLHLPLGSFVLPEGLIRTTYIAGFAHVPDDIKLATSYYAADELQGMVSRGAYDVQSSKTRYRYRDPQSQSTNYVKDAEAIIDRGNYRRRGP